MSSTTIFTVVVALANAAIAVFTYLLSIHNTKNDRNAKKEEKIQNAEDELENACNTGSISDLIDATKKLGDARK